MLVGVFYVLPYNVTHFGKLKFLRCENRRNNIMMYFYNPVRFGKDNTYEIRFKLFEAHAPIKKKLSLVDVLFDILANNRKFDNSKMSF